MQDDIDPRMEAERAAARELRKREQANNDAMDIVWLMGEPQGRRTVYTLLSRAGIWKTSFTPDPYTTAFNEGQRNVGLMLLALVQQYTPQLYTTMIEEQSNAR